VDAKNPVALRRSALIARPLPALRDNRTEAEREFPPRPEWRNPAWVMAIWNRLAGQQEKIRAPAETDASLGWVNRKTASGPPIGPPLLGLIFS
jgi:hypothetical protein